MSANPAPIPAVALLPLGQVPDMALKVAAASITGYLNLPVDILPQQPVPAQAFDRLRGQYNAAGIIAFLESLDLALYAKILGVLSVDLYLPIFTHVFGDAQMNGRFGVFSTFRLEAGQPQQRAPNALVWERGAKVGMHELGHLFNLAHCPEAGCLMHFSGDLDELDQTPPYFCRTCARRFNAICPGR